MRNIVPCQHVMAQLDAARGILRARGGKDVDNPERRIRSITMFAIITHRGPWSLDHFRDRVACPHPRGLAHILEEDQEYRRCCARRMEARDE